MEEEKIWLLVKSFLLLRYKMDCKPKRKLTVRQFPKKSKITAHNYLCYSMAKALICNESTGARFP